MVKRPYRRASDYKPTIWAAGAAIYRMRGGRPEFLLTHRPRYRDWSLPKGKLSRGESFQECAAREVFEETGITGIMEDAIGTIGYVTSAGNNKAVRYWLMQAKEENFAPNEEVDKIRWLRPRKAMEKATYSRDEAIIATATEMAREREPGVIYMVRHAHAGDKKKWRKPDDVRPVSTKGQEQIATIVNRLVRTPINNVVSSPALRCEQSVAPIAARLGIKAKSVAALRRDAGVDEVLGLIRKHRGTRTVMCSHGETIGPLIEHLSADDSVDVRGPMEWAKGSIWVLSTRRKRIVAARYIPPA